MKITLSQAIAIGTLVATLAGFYYTTQHRLSVSEAKIEALDVRVSECTKQAKKAVRLLKAE